MQDVIPFSAYAMNEDFKDTSEFQEIKFLGGSTGATLYEDGDGSKWVVKFGAHVEHVYNEYVSNKVYAKYGINVPKAFIGILNGKKALITEYLEGSVPLGDAVDLSTINDLCKGFIFDVVTANWDVVGTNWNLDNIRVKDGKVYRVDVGGALLYRAQGAPKGDRFGDTPVEHNTLRDEYMNEQTAELFQSIDDDYIANALRDVAKAYVINGKFNHMTFMREIKGIIYDEDNGMEEHEKMHLFRTLAKRAMSFYKLFN